MNVSLNQTLEKISDNIDINKSIEHTADALNKFDWKKPFTWLGQKATLITGNIVDNTSEKGFDLGSLSFKLLVLIILFGVFYLVLHFGKKPVKWILIILISLFIISVLASFFI